MVMSGLISLDGIPICITPGFLSSAVRYGTAGDLAQDGDHSRQYSFWPDASREEVIAAAKAANAHFFSQQLLRAMTPIWRADSVSRSAALTLRASSSLFLNPNLG